MQPNLHRFPRLTLLLGTALLGAVAYLASCRVDVPDNVTYRCANDKDCGGNGFKCVLLSGQTGYCCLPSNQGVEICDGIDNDCNGVVDDLAPTSCFDSDAGSPDAGRCRAGTAQCLDGGVVCVGEILPTREICNGIDDDCDGVVDDGADLLTDPINCGTCGTACPVDQYCYDGGCAYPPQHCVLSKCQDPDCEGQSCGNGCVCRTGRRVEAICFDGKDNNGNGLADCADTDCDGGSCNPDGGCQCLGGVPTETLCYDGIDNNGNGSIDCADPTCDGGSCNPDGGCACVKGARVETNCYDGIDNNGDNLIDCADSTCNGSPCQLDGGIGCLCKGSKPTEVNCMDGIDNDNNKLTDCLDLAACLGKTCGNKKTCRADGGCQ